MTEFERKLSDFCEEWAEAHHLIPTFKAELGSLLETIADRVRDETGDIQSRGESHGKGLALLKLREIAKEIADDRTA